MSTLLTHLTAQDEMFSMTEVLCRIQMPHIATPPPPPTGFQFSYPRPYCTLQDHTAKEGLQY